MVCTQCGTQNENRSEACLRCKRPLHPAAMKGKIPLLRSCQPRSHHLLRALRQPPVRGLCAVSVNGIDYCESCAPATALRQSYDEDYEKASRLKYRNRSSRKL